jgi:hypothetical protein
MSIRECLDAVHKAGGNAWDKVADPDGFIRWMRGSDDPKDVAAAEQAMQSMPAQSPASAPEQAQPRTQAEACQQPWVLTPEGARNMEEMTQAAPEQASVGAETTTGWKVEDHGADGMIVRDPSGMERSRIGSFTMAMVHLAMVLEEHDKLRAALSPRPSDVREQQAEQIAKLQRFKDWVHAYLDAQGVPHHPPGTHGAEGCRIGDRMDWLMDRLRKAEAQQAEQADGGVRRELGEVLESLDEAMGKPDRDARIAAIFMRHQTSIMKAIVALARPPRQSEDGRWISVKERMPDGAQLVLVTVPVGGTGRIVVEAAYVHGGFYGEGPESLNVTDWMPKPPPAPAAKGEEGGR